MLVALQQAWSSQESQQRVRKEIETEIADELILQGVCPILSSSSFPIRLGRRHHPPLNQQHLSLN